MGIFDNCLLACDIDGTLLSGSVLPERNVEKIKYFVSEGGSFSLSTGRTAMAVSAVTEKIDCIAPSVLTNGCVIYDFKSHKPLAEHTLTQHALCMADKVLDNTQLGIEFHTANGLFVPRRSHNSDVHEAYENMTAQFVSLKEAKSKKTDKIIYFVEDESQFILLEELAEEYTEDCTFYKTCAFIGGEKHNYYEQLPKGVSKAGALNDLCKILNIKKGGYFAIGDYYNDLPMIKAADISAVPSEAPEDIKAQASVTVGSAKSGAVADFIDYLEEIVRNGQAK